MLPLNDKSFLVQHKDGWIYLVFGGHLYARAETVPFDIFVEGPLSETVLTADAFVRLCMGERYGTDPQKWPPLARDFLNMHLPPPPTE
jgi:hypothetical protein